MKYNKIIIFFAFALPVSLALRFLQLFHIVETDTGFYKQAYEGWGTLIIILIFAFAAAVSVFSFFSHRAPEHPPKVNLTLGIFSLILAFAVIAELVFAEYSGAFLWQLIILYILGIATAVWFAVYAVKDFINIKIPPLTYAVPAGYFIIKIICNYAGISALALISDNVLLLGANCVSLLFLLNFAKLYNGLDSERGFRKLLASGLAAVLLCFTQSVPNIVYHFVNSSGYLHTAMVTNISVFFTGVFISVFVFSHFKCSNACK